MILLGKDPEGDIDSPAPIEVKASSMAYEVEIRWEVKLTAEKRQKRERDSNPRGPTLAAIHDQHPTEEFCPLLVRLLVPFCHVGDEVMLGPDNVQPLGRSHRSGIVKGDMNVDVSSVREDEIRIFGQCCSVLFSTISGG